MPRYLVSYDHRGNRWSEEITADSLQDADARLQRMALGQVDGEVKMMLPLRGFRVWLPLTIICVAIAMALGKCVLG